MTRGFYQIVTVFALILTLSAARVEAQTFEISGIRFDSSSYLDESDLRAVSDPYVGRPISFEDLQRTLEELNALYLSAGIPTAQAILPPQEIRDGILTVSLVEATVSEIALEDMPTTSDAFMRRNLSLRIGEKPDFRQLERDLIIFDLAHDIRPQLGFGAGTEPGTTRATIKAEEPKQFEFTASLDNFGRPETGETRGGLFARWNSPTGVRDALSFQAQGSEGASSASIGYSRPVDNGGGRAVAVLSYSQSQIIGGDFSPLRIESDKLSGALGYRRPVRVRADSSVILDLGVAYEQTTSSISGVDFADIEIVDAYFSAAYTRRLANATYGISLGLRAGQADAQGTSETEGAFWLLYGQGNYTRTLGENLIFSGALRYQYAEGENLPVARLITAGGVGSVRGYPNDIRGGDSGVILNMQVSARQPVVFDGLSGIELRPFGFVDAAAIVPFRASGGFDSDQDVLASVGAGVSVKLGERANLLALVAVPLKNTLGFSDKGKARLYVGLDYKF